MASTGRNLSLYISRIHKYPNGPRINSTKLSQKDIDVIGEELNCDSSPENVHEDGEISPTQAWDKWDFYYKVGHELKILCQYKGFEMPELWELDV
ncbi:uncharacterized protein METZ01_LOCUS106609 [marine metagenome]|uniref:Uncharacterized protein n=1 Tax=marine metagenome TaxID=408172 RepID=A0A381WMQ9_9ZZZZ|tara:strand:+ start:185 stop:469 length:285 start_codon:yes stop_codon:yes gene_type:complete